MSDDTIRCDGYGHLDCDRHNLESDIAWHVSLHDSSDDTAIILKAADEHGMTAREAAKTIPRRPDHEFDIATGRSIGQHE